MWLRKCYIGQVKNPDAVFLLQKKMVDEGLYSIGITPMGSDLVLIKVEEGEDFSELVRDAKELFETWFSSMDPGRGS